MFHAGKTKTRVNDPLVFIAAFAGGEDGGIHAFRLDLNTGRLEPLQRTTGIEQPFFLVLSPDHRFLYSIHAPTFGGTDHEQVAAYEIVGRTGELRLLNRQSSQGSASCYLDIDATGKTLVVANYTSGSVAALPVREDGSLGEATSFFQHAGSSVHPERQEGPHAHCIVISPDNRLALAADLGLDQILIYGLDAATSRLSAHHPPFVRSAPGAGPRHLIFHPNSRHVYVINELGNSITLLDCVADCGLLVERQTVSTLPIEFHGENLCADVKITTDGRFLYGTNRGHDSVAAYCIDGGVGRLTPVAIESSLGKGPQNLAITPGGELLLCANMPGNNVAVFRIDPVAGRLSPVGPPVEVPRPSCIRLLP
jgi:6-phosphogluconolactonase